MICSWSAEFWKRLLQFLLFWGIPWNCTHYHFSLKLLSPPLLTYYLINSHHTHKWLSITWKWLLVLLLWLWTLPGFDLKVWIDAACDHHSPLANTHMCFRRSSEEVLSVSVFILLCHEDYWDTSIPHPGPLLSSSPLVSLCLLNFLTFFQKLSSGWS